MPGVNDPHPRPDVDRTELPSQPSASDETGASAAGHPPAAPALGPPVEPGEVGTLGPYRLVKELGKGGMGAVYAALDTRLHRRLALKLMLPQFAADPAARERFLREARACAQVIHDNVVTVYDADVRDGIPYIAMQYLEGYPLDEYLKRKGTPSLQQVLRIGRDAAAGLAAAHAKGLVHRDIKPANLWLEAPHGRVKVLDFGLARPVDAEAEITKQGSIVGTPAYMSPEQARGLRVDHRTDLFSLGAVLYRLCTGRLPFQADTTMGVLMALASEEPPPVREMNPAVTVALADLIHQLLSKNPANRPPSADDVAARLRMIAQATVADAPGQPSVPQVVYVPIQVTAASSDNPFADLDVTEGDVIPTAVPVGAKPRGRTLLAAAGLVALVAAVFAVVVVVIRSREDTVAKVDPPPLSPANTTGKGGKAVVLPGPKATDNSADRKAAVWVLGIGGHVRVSTSTADITAASDLPQEPFALVEVGVNSTSVSVDDVAMLAACRQLRTVGLAGTGLTDAGLAHLAGLTGLTSLSIYSNPITDAGLARLKGLTALTYLDLNNLPGVTDAGLVHLQGLKELTRLQLGGTGIRDAGLGHLKGVPKLTTLWLGNSKVTDAGLAHLSGHTELGMLALDNTAVTDAGLTHLREVKTLQAIDLRGTKVTPKGMADFHAALPTCRIDYDGGSVAAVEVDRIAAEWAIGLGGSVKVRGVGGDLRAVADLPKERFALTAVTLPNVAVSDADLAQLDHCREIKQFSASGSKVAITDAGLARLKGLKKLGRLDIGCRGITDAGLAHLKDFPDLGLITLDGSGVTDAGLVHFKSAPGLFNVSLGSTQVTDAGLIHFKSVPALTNLSLDSTQVTDAGLPALAECRKLTVLHLRGTKVTAEGLAAFQARLPGCRVTYTDGVLEPIDVDRRAAERTIVLGGGVRVNDSLDVIEAVAKLPAGPLTLNYVVLTDKPVADADLTVFRPCTKLREVHLAGTKVTNAGLAAFEACADLHQLSLGGTAVTDAGLAHFRRAGGLWFVSLVDTAVTDAGLDHLRNATKLSQVYLRKTRVTGPGLATFRGCRELLYLDLAGSPVTDEGISHLYACTKLGTLIVRGTKVTPKGLADFHAAVPGCKVEHDGGVIEAVDVDRIAAEWVTSVGGVVRINGGGIEFRDAAGLPPDRFTMTWVSLERAKFSDADLARLKAPAGLTHLGLNVPGATDAAMTHVAGIRGLKTLSLNGTAVTDFGLGRLHGCRSLRKLSIGGTRVTPAGIEAFRAAVPGCRVNPGGTQTIAPLDPERAAAEWVLSVGGAVRLDGRDRDLRSATDLPKERFALTGVKLAGIAVGNADLAEFKECVRLESLDLAGTNVAGTGLDHLKDCTKLTTLSLARSAFQDNSTDRFRHLPLTTLDLSDTPLTDVGVRRLKECRTLTSLDVRRTRVSGVVLAELREALPGCRIQHDGGVLEPKN